MKMLRNSAFYSVPGICIRLGGQWDNLAARGQSGGPWEIYHLEERGKILGGVRRENTGTIIG